MLRRPSGKASNLSRRYPASRGFGGAIVRFSVLTVTWGERFDLCLLVNGQNQILYAHRIMSEMRGRRNRLNNRTSFLRHSGELCIVDMLQPLARIVQPLAKDLLQSRLVGQDAEGTRPEIRMKHHALSRIPEQPGKEAHR